ncbi:MAG: leishmanolysin-related zinc metalloendopeptidase [Acidimicrobiales bacterium]
MTTRTSISSRPKRAPRALARWAALAFVAVAATACPPTTGGGSTTTTSIDPANNHAPVVSSFGAVTSSGQSPLTTAIRWNVSDVDGQSLVCMLDLDNNGFYEMTIQGCTSASMRSASFSNVGTQTIKLFVSDGVAPPVITTSTVTVTAPAADAFNITVRIDGTMTPSQQAAFTSAAARWSQAIRTGLADTNLTIPADDCGTGAPAFSGSIDDVLIDAAIAPIDGVGSILGQAGPCYTRTVGGLPLYGVMQFDVADVASLEAGGLLDAVILHEMGHVLGFGTVWSSPTLTGAGTADPEFTGQVADGAWQAIGGGTSIPVENSGGPGTADSHWRESVFNAELMTGYIDVGSNPMSAVTIGSLADLGYGVNLAAADPYGFAFVKAPSSTPAVKVDTKLVHPKGSR